jgi:uncharacterized integral membrane protein (TIGR00697 family)
MTLDGRGKLFLALACLFVTSLLVGDIIGGKLYQTELGGVVLTISVGMIPFPVVFLLTDLVNEFYGQKAARYLTLVGFVMTWFTIAIFQLADAVPFAGFTGDAAWTGINGDAFERVFMSSTRIMISSTAAYLIAQLVDIGIFHALRRHTGGRMLWLRATGSTIVSQLIDTCVIQFLAWSGKLPVDAIVSIVVTSYVVKVVIAIAMTPLIYGGHALIERTLGLEPVHVEGEPAA